MTTTTLADQLAEHAARVHQVWPAVGTTPLDDDTRRIADDAVKGVMSYQRNGWQSHTIGRANLDWTSRLSEHGTELRYRMGYIVALTAAYLDSGDDAYAEAARDYMVDFIAFAPSTEPWQQPDRHSVLDLGVRLKAWGSCLWALAKSPVFDEALLAKIVEAVRVQANFLVAHISPTINWRTHNASGILYTGLWLGFHPDAARWRTFAVQVLNDAYFRQFNPDGSHYEHNPGYHSGMCNTMTQLWQLKQAMPELGLAMDVDQLARMHDYAVAVTRPNGFFNGMHDIQGDRTGRTDNAMIAGRRLFREQAGLPHEMPPTSQFFPDAGQALLRTGWDEDASYVTFDATNWGDGHTHLSRNGVQLHAHRRTLVADPGWLSYEDPVWGPFAKSTRAHSTCNLNGWSQMPVDPDRTRHYHAPGYDAVHSIYNGGYFDSQRDWTFKATGPGVWAEHARTMFWVHGRFLFVVDSMFRLPRTVEDPTDEQPSYECNWQLCEGAALDLAPDASRATAIYGDSNLLMLFPIRPAGTTLTAHAGEMDPPRGWMPSEGLVPAPQLALTATMTRQHDYYVSVLVPFTEAEPPTVAVEAESPMGQVGYVKLMWGDGRVDEVHWGCGFNIMVGEAEGLSTDSSLVHLHRQGDAVRGGCVVHGTYLHPHVAEAKRRPATFTFAC